MDDTASGRVAEGQLAFRGRRTTIPGGGGSRHPFTDYGSGRQMEKYPKVAKPGFKELSPLAWVCPIIFVSGVVYAEPCAVSTS